MTKIYEGIPTNREGEKKKILLLFKKFLAHIIGKGIQLERF